MLNCLQHKILLYTLCCIFSNLLSNTAPPHSRQERMQIFAFLAIFCLHGYKSNSCLLHVIKCVIYFIMYECKHCVFLYTCSFDCLHISPSHCHVDVAVIRLFWLRRRGNELWNKCVDYSVWSLLCLDVSEVIVLVCNLWARENDLISMMQRKGKTSFDRTVREV